MPLPEKSDEAFEELVANAENLVKGLGFHFRTVKLAAEDCSASMARTYDIEINIPSMNGYKEVSSVSNARDYQARRGMMRVKRNNGKVEFLHTLNGSGTGHFPVTGAAISRHLSVLKEADLIRDTREGKFIYYELNASVLEEIMLWITDLKGENDHAEKE